MLFLVNYGYNPTFRNRERHSQSLVKVGQTRSNLLDGLKTTGLGEINILILIIRIEEYGDILMFIKFETNWMVRLREYIYSYIGTQHMSIMCNS